MLLLPYRAKNPPDSFPYCTIGLIAINVLVYIFTTSGFNVTDWSLEHLAVSHNTLSLWRLITAMFLHENFLHIAGNMLFLWIFGAAVEGRLRHWKFLTIYFAAGLLGGILSDLCFGVHEPDQWSLGASGAIMGVLGAYLYMFPFSNICVFWWLFIRVGITQWQAMWLIGLFVVKDMLEGWMSGGNDGIGHVAHLSGFALGYVAAMAFRPKVDTQSASEVKATLADIKDVTLLNINELHILLKQPQDDPRLVLAYCDRCPYEAGEQWPHHMVQMMRRYQAMVVDQADCQHVARLLLGLPLGVPTLPGIAYLRVGTRLEQCGAVDTASLLYRRILDMAPNSRDAETALFRLGRLLERVYKNPAAALETYREMLRRFPEGAMALDARHAVASLESAASVLPPATTPVYRQAPAKTVYQPVGEPAVQKQQVGQAAPAGDVADMGAGRMIEL